MSLTSALNLRDLSGNSHCADCQDCDCPECGFPDPVWACVELGILICEECMDIHRTLSKHVFKSIICHDWTEVEYQKMVSASNTVSNEKYEKHVGPAFKKPTRCFNVEFRRHWVLAKYIRMDFASPDNLPKYLLGQKTGYLWKLGRDGRVFQRRWFVLDGAGRGTLRYYTDANKQTLRGEIMLFQMNLAVASEEKIGHPNGLQIIYPDPKSPNTRIIYLYAEMAKDMVEWYQAVRCLKYAIQESKGLVDNDRMLRRSLQYEVIKEGYLFKTGTKAKGAFRKRWMILDPLCLMYFKDPLDANPKGTIPIRAGYSLIISGQLDPERRGYHFFLKTPGRIYHFISETDYERTSWFKHIHAVCSGAHKQKQKQKVKPKSPIPNVPGSVDSTKGGAASVKAHLEMKKEQLVDSDEPTFSSPFSGVRPSTKPRPANTLTDYHKSPGNAAHGRYKTAAESMHQSALEALEDDKEEDDPEDESTASAETDSSSDEDDEESPYIDIESEKVVMMQKVDIVGMTTKHMSTHLKVPPRALPMSINCTMCVSLVWNTMPKLPASDGYVSICPIVSCCSMPRNIKLLQSFQLEIQHSAILKDVTTCIPKVWYLNKEPGKFFKWQAVDTLSALSILCKANHRACCIESMETGCYTVMLPSDAVSGKIMRCMAYMCCEQGGDHLVARIYFLDDNGSDDVLHEIQRRELTYSGRLCDISVSFYLANTKDDVFMTLDDFKGMNPYIAKSEAMCITVNELWQKQLVCYMVEIVKTDHTGECTVNVWQDNNKPKTIQMNLHFSDKEEFSVIAPVPYTHISGKLSGQLQQVGHKAVSRVQSVPVTQSPTTSRPLLAHRARDGRFARSMPTHPKLADPSAKPVSTSNIIPFSVKRDLFLLLDTKLPKGNDWRMLASQLGLDAMIYCFDLQVNPTMEVLKLFELMDCPLKDLEDHLRHIGRDDAADVLKVYIQTSSK